MYTATIDSKYVTVKGQRVPAISRQYAFASWSLDVIPLETDADGNEVEIDIDKKGLVLGFEVTFPDAALEEVQGLFTLSHLVHHADPPPPAATPVVDNA